MQQAWHQQVFLVILNLLKKNFKTTYEKNFFAKVVPVGLFYKNIKYVLYQAL